MLILLEIAISIKVFSTTLIVGTMIKKYEKYNNVDICPNYINGD